MWNLTMKAREQAERAHIIIIPESDKEWEEYLQDEENITYYKQRLQEEKSYLLTFLPQQFHRFIEEELFYSSKLPSSVRADYLSWQAQQEHEFHEVLDAAYANKMATCAHLNEHSKAIFSESLHDFQVINIVREENQLKLVFDTGGGFSTKSYVVLTLTGIVSETGHVQIGQNYAYDELIKTDRGIAWRVLFDCAEEEWTIEAEQFDAEFYYYPKTREQFSNAGDFNGYVNSLNRDYQYTWISSNLKSAIVSLQPFELQAGALVERENGVFVGGIFIADKLEECIDFIHTNTYEDPYAHFSEAVADADLLAYAMSTDMEKTVRAWNTMYAEPVRLQATINAIFLAIEQPDIDDMMQYVYVRHFENEGILSAEVRLKFADFFK